MRLKELSGLAVLWLAVIGVIILPALAETGTHKAIPWAERYTAGERLYTQGCKGCHPNGGNVIQKNRPVVGAPQLSDFDTFKRFIRNPVEPGGARGLMPPFPPSRISDEQSRLLYDYIVNVLQRR